MSIWISRDGKRFGPYTPSQLEEWLEQGKVTQHDLAWSEGNQWRPLGDLLREAGCVIPPPPPKPSAGLFAGMGDAATDDTTTVRRIADYEKISGVMWIVLGVLQCLTLFGLIAGLWNIFAGLSRVRAAPIILARHPGVPAMFESIAQLVIIGVINLLLGGAIGVLFVVFDFVIRDMVLRNRHLFEQVTTAH